MSTLLWVLAGILAYTLAAVILDRRGLLPESFSVTGPMLTIRTGRGRDFLDWLSGPKRFWRALGNVGVGVALVIMVGAFLLLIIQSFSILQSPPTENVLQNPQNVLVIPGVNEFLPLSVAPEIIIGLLIGLVVHEGGHGLFCRVEDIEIKSMGVALFALLPIGAFVEPDEESAHAARRGPRTRMYAAGVMNNLIVTVIVFALLFGPVGGAIAVAPGAAVGGVFPGGAAEAAGIDQGDRIVAIDGQPVDSDEQLMAALSETEANELTITLADDREVTVERSALITAVVADSPFATDDPDDESGIFFDEETVKTITAIGDTPVRTESDIRAAAEDDPVVELTVENDDTGEETTVEGPFGVFATVSPDSGLSAAGAPAGERIVITEIDGERIVTFNDLETVLADRSPGEELSVVGYIDGTEERYTVELQPHPDGNDDVLIGIAGATGMSGISVNSVGVMAYPADHFLSILSGEMGDGMAAVLLFLIILPFISVIDPSSNFNFAGFVESNAAFYEVVGPLAALGDGTVFLIANVLFWSGWINFNLALFNCIPAFPLDGGHILRTSTEAIISRLPIDDKPTAARTVTTSVGLIMLVSLILMVFGPQLLN